MLLQSPGDVGASPRDVASVSLRCCYCLLEMLLPSPRDVATISWRCGASPGAVTAVSWRCGASPGDVPGGWSIMKYDSSLKPYQSATACAGTHY